MKNCTQALKRAMNKGEARAMVLLLPLILVQAAQAANTWDGGGTDDNWSSAANWDNDQVPTFPAALTFGGTTRWTPSNDLVGMTVTGITYAVGAGAFTNVGNAITLGGNVTLLAGGSVTNDQTINFPITLGTNVTFSSALAGGNAVGG